MLTYLLLRYHHEVAVKTSQPKPGNQVVSLDTAFGEFVTQYLGNIFTQTILCFTKQDITHQLTNINLTTDLTGFQICTVMKPGFHAGASGFERNASMNLNTVLCYNV